MARTVRSSRRARQAFAPRFGTPPRRRAALTALTAHVLDREHHLLPIAPDAEGDQQRDGGGLAIQANLDDRAVEDQADDVLTGEIAPLPGLPGRAGLLPFALRTATTAVLGASEAADDVLADVALEQLGERAPWPAGVRPGEVDLGDQRLRPPAEPLVGRQQRALPFPLASRVGQPRPRHRQLQRAEGGDQLARPVAVTAPVRARAALIALPAERGFQLLLQQLLDERAHLPAHRLLQGIDPIAAGER
jgi:hypothetical protein